MPIDLPSISTGLQQLGGSVAVDDVLRVTNSGGALPDGLEVNTDYYVATITGSTIELSDTSGGTALSITDPGTGTHFLGEIPEPIRQAMKLLCSHWYENREAVVVGAMSREIDIAVESLLYPYRTMEIV